MNEVMRRVWPALRPRVVGLERVAMYEGWYGLDQFHEENSVLTHLRGLYEKKYGERLALDDSALRK